MGITETCSRLIGGLVQAIGVPGSPDISSEIHGHQHQKTINNDIGKLGQNNNSMQARALITVFGMQNDGKIQKDKARQVVAKLGLIRVEEEDYHNDDNHKQPWFDLLGDHEEVAIEEALGGDEFLDGEGSKRVDLLRRAFEVFDENGNGFIEAVELKRVFECLGLDCGWGMDEIEKMLKVVDLNLDGKVDFGEFQFMMMGMNNTYN